MRSRSLLPLAFALLALGCGGGSSERAAAPRLAIAWPARTRDVAAPVLAETVRVVLTPARSSATPVEAFFDRPASADAAGTVQTYALPRVKPGAYGLDVRFLVDRTPAAGGAYPALAAATLDVEIASNGEIRRADGTPLGAVATEGRVLSLDTSDTFVEVGDTRPIRATINLVGGGVLAAPAKALRFTVSGGDGVLRLNEDGAMTGLGEGQAAVTIAAGNASSAPKTITVFGARLTPRTVHVGTQPLLGTIRTSLALDPAHGKLWAIGEHGPTEVDPVAGTVVRDLGTLAHGLAVSDDGSVLYAMGYSVRDDFNAIVRLDLASGLATGNFGVPVDGSDGVVADLAVVPGRNDQVVVASYPTNRPNDGTRVALYQDGAARPNAVSFPKAGALAWASPTRLVYASTLLALRSATVDAQGLTPDAATGTLSAMPAQTVVADGRVYGSDGSVFDAATLARVGTLPIVSLNVQGIAASNGLVYALYADPNAGDCLVVYRAADLSFVTRRRVTDTPYGLLSRLVRWGDRGLAYLVANGDVYLVEAPGL